MRPAVTEACADCHCSWMKGARYCFGCPKVRGRRFPPSTRRRPRSRKGQLMDTKHLGINSKLIHAGHKADATGSVNTPIYQTSTRSEERRVGKECRSRW